MSHRSLVALATVIALGWITPVPASGQNQPQSAAETAPTWTPPRTPDGRPDLQGVWTTQTFTPLERPEYLGDRAWYTEEEWAALQAQLTSDGVDPLARSSINIEDAATRETALHQSNRDASYVHYDNAIWLATDVPKGLSSRRTSLITDPADGQVPPGHRKPSSARPMPVTLVGNAAPSTATRPGPWASGASSTDTTARRCCHRRTTMFIRFFRRPITWSSSPR